MKIVFSLANSADPDEMPPYVAFHLGLHCLPKHLLLVSKMKRVKINKNLQSNPFKPNGLSSPYHLEESITNFRLLGAFFHKNSNLIEHL